MERSEEQTADADAPNEREDAPRPEQALAMWFGVVTAVSILSMVWMAARVDSPSYVHSAMDFFLHAATGGCVAYLAFRVLVRFPFHTLDLLAMVLVLSLGMRVTLAMLQTLSALVELHSVEDPRYLSRVLQVCLITGSVLLVGAAFGLRNCQRLKIEQPLRRIVTIVAGMLVLPAAAGVLTFLLLLIMDVLSQNGSPRAPVLAALWLGSVVVTVHNVHMLIRSLALQSVIDAQEREW